MEMTYGGALVMPSSYAMMDEEEMMYLEGGAIKVDTFWVAFTIDVAVTLVFGGAATSALGWLMNKGMSKIMNALIKGTSNLCTIIKNALGNGVANMITRHLGIVGTVLSFTSVGGAVANLWDMFDNGNLDGHVWIG